MEALKPKHATKMRKPKREERSETTPTSAVRLHRVGDVTDTKLTARIQSSGEFASEQSRSANVPQARDSEAQPYKSVEIVVPSNFPESCASFELPKESAAVCPAVNEPEANVPPPNEVVASAPPSDEIEASAPPPNEVRATVPQLSELKASEPQPSEVIVSVASANEVKPSAPPDDEPLFCKIYPDLPTLEMAQEQPAEQYTMEFDEANLPALLTSEERSNVFEGVQTCWLSNVENWFLVHDQMFDAEPEDSSGWSRALLRGKLSSYGSFHHQLTGQLVEQRKATQKKLTHLEDEIWLLEERVFESTGVCQDRREVKAKVKRTFAVFDGARGETAQKTLSITLDEQIKEEMAASMGRSYLRSELQHYFARQFNERVIDKILMKNITVLAEMLRNEAASQSCTQRDACPYLQDLRLWFRFACARFLRNNRLYHRLYVLFHVLRLPGGIKSWAVELIQMLPARRVAELAKNPNLELELHELREVLTMLDVIMRRVAQRNAAFRSAGASDEGSDEPFNWVGTDGEDENATTTERMLYPLTEDDMNALLEQLPVSALMQTFKLYFSKPSWLTGIVVAAEFIQSLLKGCRTYGSLDRYRNFTKLLGRLIDFIVSYANWLLQQPLRRSLQYPLCHGKMLVEYDNLFYGALSGLYRVRSNGLWQYLTSLPLNTLTLNTLWRIFYALQSGKFDKSQESAALTPQHERSESVLQHLDNDEFYYTLQLMGNMIIAQKGANNRMEFVRQVSTAMMELMVKIDPSEMIKIHYLQEQLWVLFPKHPELISTGIHLFDRLRLKEAESAEGGYMSMATKEVVLSVFNANYFDMRQWRPSKQDIDLLLYWFETFTLKTVWHRLASSLLFNIYYGEDSRGQLAVPREWQLEIVRKIVVTFRRRSETVAENFAGQFSACLIFEQQCKMMLLQFRVHALDQTALYVQRALHEPAATFNLNFVRHMYDEPCLGPGIQANCSVTSLAAVLMTTAGHWLPVINHSGFSLMKIVNSSNDTRYAIRCLELTVPLFATSPSSLTESAEFLDLLRQLILAEQRKPKNGSLSLGDASLRDMIISQISHYRRYGLPSCAALVKLWAESIVLACPDIATNMMGLSLLNDVACIALKHRDAWYQMLHSLTPLLKDPANPPKRNKPLVDQILSMFGAHSSPGLFLAIAPEHVALALLALEIEHYCVEIQTQLWPALLHQLDADGSLTLQAALAQVGAALQLQFTPAPHMLVLYKAARVLVQADVKHPLFPLLCQRFFTILLARHTIDVPVYGATERLLTVDVQLVVHVNKQLHNAEAHYASLQRDSSKDQRVLAFYKQQQSTFQMFTQWLGNRQLNGIPFGDLDRLPQQYCVPRLKMVFAGMQDFWVDLVDWSTQSKKETDAQGKWHDAYHHIHQTPPRCIRSVAEEQREAVLQRQLKGYQKPAPLTSVALPDMKVLRDNMNLPCDQRMELIIAGLRKIDQHTQRLHRPTIVEFNRLKHEILVKTKALYTNKKSTVQEQAKCSLLCEGAGTVRIPVEEATRSEHILQRLEDYRRDLGATVEAAIYLPPHITYEIVQCRMLWNSLLADKPVTPRDAERILKLVRTVLQMLREDSPDYLTYTVNESLLQCFELLPELVYTEVATLLRTTLKQKRKPPSAVMDLLNATVMPMHPMKVIYALLTNGINKVKQALFIQLFGDGKFDVSQWLVSQNAEEQDVGYFIKLTSAPLRREGYDMPYGTEVSDISKQYHQILVNHAIQLAFHAFPVNFCAVLRNMLCSARVNNPAVPPTMLVDLVNSVRAKLNLAPLNLPMDDTELRAAHCELALANNARKGPFNEIGDSLIQTIADHFNAERLIITHSNGLYMHYPHRVKELAVVIGAIAHLLCMERTCRNVCNFSTFDTVERLFKPWLVPYAQGSGSVSGPLEPTLPWSSEGIELATIMLNTMVQVVLSFIDKINRNAAVFAVGANSVLPHVLKWYECHFSNPLLPDTVLRPLHAALWQLPWGAVLPTEYLITWLAEALQNESLERTKFVCQVFVRCGWLRLEPSWLDNEPTTRRKLLSLCLSFACEPRLRKDEQLTQDVARTLDDIAQLPWGALESLGLETAIDFYIYSTESSIVLRSPTAPLRQLDEAILGLLEIASGVSSNAKNPLKVASDHTPKRGRYIRAALLQLANVATMPKATVTVTNVKLQVAETMRTILDIVIRPLEALVPEDDSVGEAQLREARALLTAMILGIRNNKVLHQPFSSAFIELLTSETHASIRKPLAYGMLSVMKLLGENMANLMAVFEVTLFSCLNASANVAGGDMISWAQALELIGAKVAKEWNPEVLASDGHVLSLQLHFLAHWRHDTGAAEKETPTPKLTQLRQMLRHLKNTKKETDVHHIYPLWVTMMYGLLTLAPTTPVGTLVESFSEYLTLIGHQASSRSWIIGIVQNLMSGKKMAAASHRIISLGFNCCIIKAYRTQQATEKGDTDIDHAAEPATAEEAPVDPTDALRLLADEAEIAPLRDKLEELVDNFPTQLFEADATMALAKRIVQTFDSRAVRMLDTLLPALAEA